MAKAVGISITHAPGCDGVPSSPLPKSKRATANTPAAKTEPTPAPPQHPIKTDILGVRLGLTESEAIQAFNGNGSCGVRDYSKAVDCKMTDQKEQFKISYTEKLDTQLVREIQYFFFSGSRPDEMISIVSEQFGISPASSHSISNIQLTDQHPTNII